MQHQEREGVPPKGKKGEKPGKKSKNGGNTNAADAFAFHPTFHFGSEAEIAKQDPSDDGAEHIPQTPRWIAAAKAPVAFGLQDFWAVMDRWIAEAPSIIPPVESVDIIHDTSADTGDTPRQDDQFPAYALLTDRKRYRRAVHRRLVPRRKDKDQIVDEAVFFYDAEADSGLKESNTFTVDQDKVTAYAIFAPLLEPSATEASDANVIEELAKSLPFYYPAIRAFRYGYRQDPEDELDEENEGHGWTATGDTEYNEESVSQVRRAGWITLDLLLAGDEGAISNKQQYAFKELFKKLFKWGVNTTKGYTKSKVQLDVLVPKALYLETYARLKEKHAKKWVEQWPERTDPRKFVFEDIAIAAWLVALWQLEREQQQQQQHGKTRAGEMHQVVSPTIANKRPKLDPESASLPAASRKQTFVDLGCGNGLLTHILNEEGHVGMGIDISSRKVWELYGPNTKLEAKALIPNEANFDKIDWIIGNHADELAPWVPIIASRSKPWTKFVVIPCCFFDLTGKYTFPNGFAEGKYKAYVDFIESVMDLSGYQVEREVLRIPSTKNIALVGRIPKLNIEHTSTTTSTSVLEQVDAYVQSRGASAFVPRLSDREKQQLCLSSHEASLVRRGGATTSSSAHLEESSLSSS